jgi:hypothetical protein
MRVSDIKNLLEPSADNASLETVDAAMPLVNLISTISNASEGRLAVTENGQRIGTLTAQSLLSGLSTLTASDDDGSVVEMHCPTANYSASEIARATEDVNVAISDLYTHPDGNGALLITLRLRTDDPSAAIRNLQRYGYEVTDSYTHRPNMSITTAIERFAALQAILNV